MFAEMEVQHEFAKSTKPRTSLSEVNRPWLPCHCSPVLRLDPFQRELKRSR